MNLDINLDIYTFSHTDSKGLVKVFKRKPSNVSDRQENHTLKKLVGKGINASNTALIKCFFGLLAEFGFPILNLEMFANM